jgi:hypothetical protein
MFPGGGGGKCPLLRNWLLVSTGEKRPLIGGTKPGPTTLFSTGTDLSYASVEEELDQDMVGPMLGLSSFHPVCMEKIGTQSQMVLYEG